MRLVAVTAPTDEAELVADRLWAAGAQAVEERVVSPGMVELRTSLGPDPATEVVRLEPIPSRWRIDIVEVDATPAQTWRDFATIIEVSPRLRLVPAWLVDDETSAATVRDTASLDILIEPGGSFGLGDHPTTRLSAALVDEWISGSPSVLDVGCGSGVLGVLAARRGARRVRGIDVSADAVAATLANAERNGVAFEASTTPLDHVEERYDVVVANILAPTLVALADDLRRVMVPTGCLIISGVLDGDYSHVLEALKPLERVDERVLDGWAAAVLAWPPSER